MEIGSLQMKLGKVWLLEGALSNRTNTLIKWEIWTQREAHGRTPCKDEGRDWDYASTNQGTKNCQKMITD